MWLIEKSSAEFVLKKYLIQGFPEEHAREFDSPGDGTAATVLQLGDLVPIVTRRQVIDDAFDL